MHADEDMYILVYDTDSVSSFWTVRMLMQHRFVNTVNESDRNNIFRMVKTNPPDVIMTDHRLWDGLDGIEFIRELRTFSQTPVIIYTDYMDRKIAHAVFDLPAVFYLRRTDNEEAFIATMKKIKQETLSNGTT